MGFLGVNVETRPKFHTFHTFHGFHGFHGFEAPMAAYFAAQNRNKSSVTLNYTKPQGQELVKNDEGHECYFLVFSQAISS